MSDFLAMGGYAEFVWPAYAITLAALFGMVGITLRAYRRAQKRLRELGSR